MVDKVVTMSSSHLVIFILFSGFQCSKWAKYASDVVLEIEPNKLIVVNDSVSVKAKAFLNGELSNKVDSIEIRFYYVTGSYLNDSEGEVGRIILVPDLKSATPKSVQLKFRYKEGRSLYAKQTSLRRNRKIESPLLIVAEH